MSTSAAIPLSIESAPIESDGRSTEARSTSAVVEFWGLPHVGKSVLLASLYKALSDFGLRCIVAIPPERREAFDALAAPSGGNAPRGFSRGSGEPAGGPDQLEELHFGIDVAGGATRSVCVRARHGEQLLAAAASDDASERWMCLRRGTIFIACVNPFLIDEMVAWKGLQQLMARLQAPPSSRSLSQAFSAAAQTLLHVDSDLLRDRATLAGILPESEEVIVQHDTTSAPAHDPFSWGYPDGRPADATRTACHAWLHEQIRLAAPGHQLLRRALAASRNSVAVLTHIDLIDVILSSISFADVERIFDHLFEGRVDHHVGQQVAGRLFQIELPPWRPESAPSEPFLACPPGLLRHDAGVRLLEYLHVTVPRNGQVQMTPVVPDVSQHSAAREQAGPARVADAVETVRQKARNKLAELKRIAQAAVAERDTAIKQLKRQLRTKDAEVTRLAAKASAAWSGVLSPEESVARDQYEQGRIGITQAWALLAVRSLPALPLAALLTSWLLGAAGSSSGPDRNFLLASLITLAVYGAGSLAGLVGLWKQLGPRWIWLRRLNTRSAALEVLTSGGEAMSAPASEFTLERSPVLGLLGIAVVRQNVNGRRFVTSEPGAWLAAPQRPATRWRVLPDCVLLLSMAAWVAWAIALLVRS